MLMLVMSSSLLGLFIGWEGVGLCSYLLIGFWYQKGWPAEAGQKAFVVNRIGDACFVIGSFLLVQLFGTLDLSDIGAGVATLLEDGGHSTQLMLAALLLFGGACGKVSVFPFQFWVPDVYQGSPTPVTVFMATGTKAAAFAFLMKVVFLLPASAAGVLGVMAIVTMAIGNLGALIQEDLKRMLGYSSVAHAGTLLLVVTASLAGDPQAGAPLQAALYYMAAYVFTAAGAFGLIAVLEGSGEHFTKLESLRGLGTRRPMLAGALSLFMLSLGGFPATGGFFGKYFVFSSTLRADMTMVSVLGVLLSVVALGYYLRVILTMWMRPEKEGQAAPSAYRPAANFATGLCVFFVLALGFAPGWFLERFF
ncbi:UNVERIFIED_CONTAM: hypothetical protein GTU68_005309 [Idotea baltica]|nr:hypothetical protein [Idotea baltica]